MTSVLQTNLDKRNREFQSMDVNPELFLASETLAAEKIILVAKQK